MNTLANEPVGEPHLKEMVERIETTVRNRHGGWILDFHVDVAEQGLVLHGWTPTYYAKQVVQDTAMKVGGLPIIANCIEVSLKRN